MRQRTQSRPNSVENVEHPWGFVFDVNGVAPRIPVVPYFAQNAEKDYRGPRNQQKGLKENVEAAGNLMI